jgi:hypothetical protein
MHVGALNGVNIFIWFLPTQVVESNKYAEEKYTSLYVNRLCVFSSIAHIMRYGNRHDLIDSFV